MKISVVLGVVVVLLAEALAARSASQPPTVRDLDPSMLRQYGGVYQWGPNAFVYLQMWKEFSGTAINSSRSMNPARFGRCIPPIATSSSQARRSGSDVGRVAN